MQINPIQIKLNTKKNLIKFKIINHKDLKKKDLLIYKNSEYFIYVFLI